MQRYNLLVCALWAFGCPIWYVCLFTAANAGFRHDHFTAFAFLGIALVLGVPVMCPIFSLMAFPLPYSIFGKVKRTPLPADDCVFVLNCSGGTIGRLHATPPLVMWAVYKTGVGIHNIAIGKVFLPKTSVTSVAYNWLGQCVIRHSCQELRSPVVAPSAIGRIIGNTWSMETEDGEWGK
jgi:hypothetical protein